MTALTDIHADQINRAQAKVQAARLEAMEGRQVTVAGNSHALTQFKPTLTTLQAQVAAQRATEPQALRPLNPRHEKGHS